MRTTHLLALLCAASLTGCLESEAILELNPNGGGTVAVDLTLDLAESAELLDRQGLSQDAAARQSAVELLQKVKGIDAWSDLIAEVKSGRIHVRGKGWFKDASALSVEHETGTVGCALDVGASEAALRLIDERGSRLALALMQYGPRAMEQVLDRRFGDARPTLRALQVKVPGNVVGASYAWGDRDARGATLEDSPAGWEGMLERYQARVARLEETAKLTEASQRQTQLLFAVPKLRWVIDPDAGGTFAADYAAAVAAWQASEWYALFEGEPVAAETPTEMAETPAETPADTPTATDPYEENDLQVAAKQVEAGLIEDLLADGQDWYQVEIQPGQTIRVGVQKSPDAKLGLILLAGGNLRRGTDTVEWSNSASQPRLAQFVVTGQGYYHMNVAVE